MTTSPPDHALDLLLARAEDGRPVLEAGLPSEAISIAPKPKKSPRDVDAMTRDAPDADPNDLPEQRWGVIAPHGSEGDRLLEAIAPLMRLREAEQGAPPQVYRVDAGMDTDASLRFREDVYRTEDMPEYERPRYLLILGDLHQVSSELQHVLANGAFVGRIHFADSAGQANPAGYAVYAEKVVSWAGRSINADAMADAPDALFYTVRDGTRATAAADTLLVQPCLRNAEAWRKRGRFPAASVVSVADDGARPGGLLRAAQGARPAVLLSVSHGLGAPREGWSSAAQQRAMQGALDLGAKRALTAETLGSTPFLPGGMWLCFACFSLGTPSASAFFPWLSLLIKEGAYSAAGLDAVLKSLPKEGDRPFLAAMPQAALANPQGPLAVIGHIDLAWTYAFVNTRNQSRASRFLSAVRAMVNGSRAGVALDALTRFYRETNDALMAGYQVEQAARVRGEADPTDRMERGNLWMLRNDLRGYMLLGDPAARLPLRAEQKAC